jgi:hypothetical protein
MATRIFEQKATTQKPRNKNINGAFCSMGIISCHHYYSSPLFALDDQILADACGFLLVSQLMFPTPQAPCQQLIFGR